jgi:hypothetical protein
MFEESEKARSLREKEVHTRMQEEMEVSESRERL